MKLRLFLLASILFIFQLSLFGEGITEEEIPDPEHVYELPESLLGNFAVKDQRTTITIYPSNKYIMKAPISLRYGYGHVIREDNDYFFIPIPGHGNEIIREKTQIYFEGDMFYIREKKSARYMNIKTYEVERVRDIEASPEALDIYIPHHLMCESSFVLILMQLPIIDKGLSLFLSVS